MIRITTNTNGKPDKASEQTLLACIIAALRKSARFKSKLQENLIPSAWEPNGDGSMTASLVLPDGTSSGHTVTASLENGRLTAVSIEHSDGSTLEWSPSPMEEYLISNTNPEPDDGGGDTAVGNMFGDLANADYEPGSLIDQLFGGIRTHGDTIPTSFKSLTEMESVMVEVDMALEETATKMMTELEWNSVQFIHNGEPYTAVPVGPTGAPFGVKVSDPSGNDVVHPGTDILHDLCLTFFYQEQ